YFDEDRSTESGRFVGANPFRVIDTRLSSPFPQPGCVGPAAILRLTTTSTEVGGFVLNVTVTEPTAPGHLTVFPAPPPVPLASNLNFVPGQTVPNLVMVRVGEGGGMDFANSAGCTHLVIDVFGAFTNATVSPAALSASAVEHLADQLVMAAVDS
ncbi:MAG TPA: hypothetical protein VFZ17_00130, partial [Acidimicrobiia bacterium]|nr:hypothetical protein [Acidimicrobiia bacterium]